MPTPAPTTTPAAGAPKGAFGGRPSGPRPRPKSRYGTQMAEKQNLKQIFGIREEQLRKYYAEARSAPEQTGQALVSLLERRLDNAIYRAGFAPTRPGARQMATHRLLAVNDRPVDIPSHRLKVGDKVTVIPSKRGKSHFTNWDKRMQNVRTPSWITLDVAEFGFSVRAVPTAEEANLGVEVQSIVEYFAR